jgi:hypothetical protein
MRTFLAAIVLAAVGLGVGYLIFGQVNGSYVEIQSLIREPKGVVDNVTSAALGLGKMRQNILICGAVGAVLGIAVGAFGGRRR